MAIRSFMPAPTLTTTRIRAAVLRACRGCFIGWCELGYGLLHAMRRSETWCDGRTRDHDLVVL